MYMLDTNILIYAMRHPQDTLVDLKRIDGLRTENWIARK